MELLAAVRLVRFTLGLLFLWGLFYLCLRKYLLDDLRQTLFAIRDNLFDFAADGGIGFDDFCYRDLRNDINGLIYFADKMSLLRIGLAPLPDAAFEKQSEWLRRVRQLAPLPRKTLLAMRQEALGHAMNYVIRRSLVLLLASLVLRFAALWIDAAGSVISRLRGFGERLEAHAWDEYSSAA
jgi:hypothetical protein